MAKNFQAQINDIMQPLEQKFNDKSLSALSLSVANALESQVADSFILGKDLSGKQFKPLTKKYGKYKTKKYGKQPILTRTRNLRESLTVEKDGSGFSLGVNANSQQNYPYGVAHNFGLGKLPQRQFFPINKDGSLHQKSEAIINEVLDEYLKTI